MTLKIVLLLTVGRWQCTVVAFGENTLMNDDVSQVENCMSDRFSSLIFLCNFVRVLNFDSFANFF